jgi:hypothetical protein
MVTMPRYNFDFKSYCGNITVSQVFIDVQIGLLITLEQYLHCTKEFSKSICEK